MKPIKVMASLTVAASVLANGAFSAFAAEGEHGGVYGSTGSVTFEASNDSTLPVDPSDPGNIVKPENPDGSNPEPGTSGPLSIDFASSLDFGTNVISNQTEVYYAAPQKITKINSEGVPTPENRPNYVQISDNRGTNQGWALTVTQNGQLSSTEDTLNNELTGAQITLTGAKAVSAATTVNPPATYDITLDPTGEHASNVMTAQVGEGAMTWVDYFGTLEEIDGEMKNTGIQLEVPGSTPKDAVEYSTTLTWTLSDVVTNDVENN